jgi:predicted ABC-type ATPase
VQRIEAWLDKSIEVHQTIGVETVLSSPKYRRLVEKAQQHEFEICFVYVFVESVELQLDRIKARVAKGGHDVPADKVASRRIRSIKQMPWFFWQADRAWIFDNSADAPSLVAFKRATRIGGEEVAVEGMFDKAALPEGTASDIQRILHGMEPDYLI